MSTTQAGRAPATPDTQAPTDDAITTRGLTKRFTSGQVAVDGIDLSVPRGTVYGFLGANGSGKTTTIRMLLGLVAPTSGDHRLLGSPMPSAAAHVLPRVGALVEGPAFHPYLSGRANLLRLDAADRTVDPSSARTRVHEALERVGLAAAATKRYRNYSLGMRQRLGLAGALLRPRDLLVLDEPTNGLDPQGTREVRALVRELGAEGTTVFLSSHLLSEIEQMCHDVGVMSHGRLVFQGTLAGLRQAAGVRVRLVTDSPHEATAVMQRLGTGVPVVLPTSAGSTTTLVADLSTASEPVSTAVLVEQLVRAGVTVHEVVVERPDLEDLFVQLTGEGFDVDQ
ncbi:MAG TPA: ABC transporter ATP-binding protein [Actinomycetales bacterium]